MSVQRCFLDTRIGLNAIRVLFVLILSAALPLAGARAQTQAPDAPQDQTAEDPEKAEDEQKDEAQPAEEADPAGSDTAPSEDGATEDADPADNEAGAEEEEAAGWGRLQPIVNLVEAGGPIIVLLAILSVISLAIVIVKLIHFRYWHINAKSFVPEIITLIQNGRYVEALDSLSKKRALLAQILTAAVRGKQAGPEHEDLAREEVTRLAQSKLDGLESGLTLLSLIATISPLLGLLGTVLGMIDAFQQLQGAGDRVDPAILSGGIWEALLTTAAGLSVAIPASAFYTWLQRSVDVAALNMENAATQVFTCTLPDMTPAVQPVPTGATTP